MEEELAAAPAGEAEMGAGGPSTEEGAPQPSLDAEVALNAPGFCPSSLVGCCLGKRFELLRHLAGVSGAYGYPYEAREVSTGQSVFVKVLRVPSQNSGYSVSRELEATERLMHLRVGHEHLASLRCVLRGTVARRCGSNEVVMRGVLAIVSDFYTSGDLFDSLFTPHRNGRLSAPRPMPEPIALHYMWQLTQAVSSLHSRSFFHRDLKPENVMFDESYNLKVTDFGACTFVPATDELRQTRSMSAVHCSPCDDRNWRVGTEAYAAPESIGPGPDGYDANKYDVWSLGVMLFLMLCIDELEVIQVLESPGQAPRTTLRMPFVSYPSVIYPLRGGESGSCANLATLLDTPRHAFAGRLEQTAPLNDRFWRSFRASQRLSPGAKDLLNRMLVQDPQQRIDIKDVMRHPWMQLMVNGGMRPSADDIRAEMVQRAPPARQIAADQRLVGLLPATEQWMSELHQSLRVAPAAGVGAFPRDAELEGTVILCGTCCGSNAYQAVCMFAELSQFLTSHGALTLNHCKSQLRLTCSTLVCGRVPVEQFVAQVLVVKQEVLISLQPGSAATEFAVWNDRIRGFVANQARLVPADGLASALERGAELGSEGGAGKRGTARPFPGSSSAAEERNVRPRLPPLSAASFPVGYPLAPVPAPRPLPPPLPPVLASPLAPASTAVAVVDSVGGHQNDVHWSWPNLEPADRGIAEKGFDCQLGVPRGGWLWMARFFDYLELTHGMPRAESEAVWHLVVPSGARAMDRESFVRAHYLLKGLAEGRALPARFPDHVFLGTPGLPAPLPAPAGKGNACLGSWEHPIRYDFFACLLRPLLEGEYRRRQCVYRKTSPVAVLAPADRSPFSARSGGRAVERFQVCNLGSGPLDLWSIKETNFLDNYQDLPGGTVYLPDECFAAANGVQLRAAVHAALACSPPHLACLAGWSLEDWGVLRARLHSERAAKAPLRPTAWRLALPRNHVVAVELTRDLLAACLAHLGAPYVPGRLLHREETYAPGYAQFREGDWAISDVDASGSGVFCCRAGTHDHQWVWKPLNKVMRGQTLITRTIDAATFFATYSPRPILRRNDDSGSDCD